MVFGFEAVLDFFMAMFTEFTVKLKRSPSMMRLDIDFNRVLPGFTVFLLFFFVRAWKSLIVLNATAKQKLIGMNGFAGFPLQGFSNE